MANLPSCSWAGVMALPWDHKRWKFIQHLRRCTTAVDFSITASSNITAHSVCRNRTRFDTNGLRYAYRDGDELQLEFEQGGAALGDLQLGAAYALYQQEQRAVSARLTLKLPTGDADQLAGSGAADLALALHGGMPWWRGQLDAAGGVVLLGDGDVLPRKQRDAAAFGHVAYAYPWTPAVALLAQLGGNTAMYADTSMEALKDSAFLAVGARWQLHPAWALEASLIEDILVNSTADVTFSLGLRYAPAHM